MQMKTELQKEGEGAGVEGTQVDGVVPYTVMEPAIVIGRSGMNPRQSVADALKGSGVVLPTQEKSE